MKNKTAFVFLFAFFLVSAFPLIASATQNHCEEELTGKAHSKHILSYESTPEKSVVIVDGEVRIEENDPRYDAYLEAYLLTQTVTIEKLGPKSPEAVILHPIKIDGRLMLQGKILASEQYFFGNENTKHGTKFEQLADGRLKVTFPHITTLNKEWKDNLKLKLVPVLADELPPFLYIQYLAYDRLAISLGEILVHDTFNHTLGFQLLAEQPRWADFKSYVQLLVQYTNKFHPSDSDKKFNSLVKILADATENATATLTTAILHEPSLIPSTLTKFNYDMDLFKRTYEESFGEIPK